MDKSVSRRIFDSFHDAESKVHSPEDEAEAREYSRSIYAVWNSISVSLSRTALLIFLLVALFELLAYQRTPITISIGTLLWLTCL
jgi:hypothetical protein